MAMRGLYADAMTRKRELRNGSRRRERLWVVGGGRKPLPAQQGPGPSFYRRAGAIECPETGYVATHPLLPQHYSRAIITSTSKIKQQEKYRIGELWQSCSSTLAKSSGNNVQRHCFSM
jgi:hypothetical protein